MTNPPVRDQQVAERLMRHFGTLEAIADASMDELQQVCGVGKSTAEMIVAAFELGLRGRKRSDNVFTISSPQSVVELLSLEMKVLKQEEMRILLLDTRNNERAMRVVMVGDKPTSQAFNRALSSMFLPFSYVKVSHFVYSEDGYIETLLDIQFLLCYHKHHEFG